MRGSSVNFQKIKSAVKAVHHASRVVSPDYLLPEHLSGGTFVVMDDEGEVQRCLTHKMSLASRQAKSNKEYSPLWEGVINLPDPSKTITPEVQCNIIKTWCVEYEKITGHKVLRADVHLDEGYVDDAGVAQFNGHAHVMSDRTDTLGKVIKLTPQQLRDVQTMTAQITGLERGVDARESGAKHISPRNFRWMAEKNRDKNRGALDKEKDKTEHFKKLFVSDTPIINSLQSKLKTAEREGGIVERRAARLATLKAQYKLDREALKASGEATQADYQALKKDFDEQAIELAKAQATADKVPELEAQAVQQKKKYTKLYGQAVGIQTERDVAQKELAELKLAPAPPVHGDGFGPPDSAQVLNLRAQKHELTTKVNTMTQKNEALTEQLDRVVSFFAPVPSGQYLGRMAEEEAQHHGRMADGLLARATEIRRQVAAGEKTVSVLVSAISHELAASKITRIAQEPLKPQTLPTPLPTPEKPPERVFPRLTQAEFDNLDAPVWNMPKRHLAAAQDVLVKGMLAGVAAALHKIGEIGMSGLMRTIEQLLAKYIAPEPAPSPPSIQKNPVKPVTPVLDLDVKKKSSWER